ncbi:hypothetical protein Bca4012_079797 [Brassica carinata]
MLDRGGTFGATLPSWEKNERTVSFWMLLTSPWLEAISTVTVHFTATSGNSITFKSLKLLAMGFAEYEEAEGRG